MRLTKTALIPALVALAALASACGGSTTSPTTTTTTTTQTITSDVLTGTVPAPVNGARQAEIQKFTVGQGGGTVTVSLTSAIEAMPDGTFLSSVYMGLAYGTYANGTCSIYSSSYGVGPSGSNYLTGSLAAGDYCLQVSDATGQLGPVQYSLLVSHP
jgi:hypothetical protein